MADVAISAQTDGTRVQSGDEFPVNRGGNPRRVKILEESTFTPTILFGGAATGNIYGAQVGRYWRFGDLIFFHIFVSLTTKGSATGIATIGGLPVAAEATASHNVAFSIRVNNLTGTTGGFAAHVLPSGTAINMGYTGTGTATNLDDTHFGNTSNVMIAGFYEV